MVKESTGDINFDSGSMNSVIDILVLIVEFTEGNIDPVPGSCFKIN